MRGLQCNEDRKHSGCLLQLSQDKGIYLTNYNNSATNLKGDRMERNTLDRWMSFFGNIKKSAFNFALLLLIIIKTSASTTIADGSINSSTEKNIDPKRNAEQQELIGLVGMDLVTTAETLGLNKQGWYLMVSVMSGENLEIAQVWDYDGINRIRITGTDAYTLDDINPLMSRDEIVGLLEQKGYEETIEKGVWEKDFYYIDVSNIGDSNEVPYISLDVIKPLETEGHKEVSGYIGRSMKDVVDDFGGNVLLQGDDLILDRDSIHFRGKMINNEVPNPNELDNIIIGQIDIYGYDTDYCIYGIVPGTTVESIGLLGLEEGGSAEIVDPMQNVVLWSGTNNVDNPRITFFRPAVVSFDLKFREEKQISEINDLTRFIGIDYNNILKEVEDISILEQGENETKLGNNVVSVTATKGDIVTRIRIDEGAEYTVEDIGITSDLSSIENKLNNKGYHFQERKAGNDEDEYWYIFLNDERNTFFAFKLSGDICEKIYYGLQGYMPL